MPMKSSDKNPVEKVEAAVTEACLVFMRAYDEWFRDLGERLVATRNAFAAFDKNLADLLVAIPSSDAEGGPFRALDAAIKATAAAANPAKQAPRDVEGQSRQGEARPRSQTSAAVRDVLAERARQIALGYTPEHDDSRPACALTDHAILRALPSWRARETFVKALMTMARDATDPRMRRNDLVQAAALLIAEIERMDRGVKS